MSWRGVVRSAIKGGQTPEELIAGGYGIDQPEDNAVVGRLFGANPPREIAPGEIGVLGFDANGRKRGDVFSIAERWAEVAAEEASLLWQAPLFAPS